jgi:hypothetical protein
MTLRPSTYVRFALRAARRRRYGYAALRVLRRGVARAAAAHLEASVGPRPYASDGDAIYAAYRRALAELIRRFPSLDVADERSRP